MSANAGKIVNRLFYAADMRKARDELLARLGVDLKKTTPKKRRKHAPAQ